MGYACYFLDVIPEPPGSDSIYENARWAIAVIDEDDPDLAFTAAAVGRLKSGPEVSPFDLSRLAGIIARLRHLHSTGNLLMQMVRALEDPLASMEVAGRA